MKPHAPVILICAGLLILATGAFVGAESYAAIEKVRDFYHVEVSELRAAGDVAFQIQEDRRAVVYALTTDNPDNELPYVDQARAAADAVALVVWELKASRPGAAAAGALREFSERWEAYLTTQDRITAEMVAGHHKEALAIDRNEARAAFDAAKTSLTRLQTRLDQWAGERLNYVTNALYRTLTEVGGLLVALLFFIRIVNTERRNAFANLQKINRVLESAQNHLQDRELKLRAVFDNVVDAIITFDERDLVLSANRATERLFGYSPAELVGKNLSILIPPAHRSAHNSYPARQRRSGEPTIIGIGREVNGVRRNGTEFPLELAVSQIVTDGRRTFVGILRDITKRKNAESALNLGRRQLMDVTTNLPGAVFQTQPRTATQRDFLFISEGIKDLIGRTPAEIIENPELMIESVHPSDIDRVVEELEAAYNAGSRFRICYRVLDNDQVKWLESSATPQEQGSGEMVWNGVITDITANKEAERKLAQYAEELATAVTEAEGATKAKSDFLATMSHEIRTPLNGVIGMTGLLLETPMTQEQKELAETIRSSSDALLAIINDILDFSKIEAGKFDLEQVPFSVRSVVEDSLEVVAPLAHRKRLELCAPMDDSIPRGLIGDAARLRQILLNLLSNGIKFTETGEVVLRVMVEPEGSDQITEGSADQNTGGSADQIQLRFEVRDTGIGISQEAQSRLFQSFTQADGSTTRQFGGTGLGLVITKRLVELMGGWIGLRSAPNAGTTFWFVIPFPVTSEGVTSEAAPETLRGRRVLAVDDNGTNRSILKQQLGKMGIAITCAASGGEAIEELLLAARHQRPYELAILDLHMPVMNGLMLAKEVRKRAEIEKTPLMMLTSDRDREEAATARELGVRTFLLKPVKEAALTRSIGEIFGAAAGSAGPEVAPVPEELHARILVVEDNATNQKVIVLRLKKLGCEVEIANNGAEGVELAALQQFDAILMDCQMPVMDGLAATAEIRRQGNRVPIIALTANAMDGERERCMEAGMDDYLSKPVRNEDLLRKLKQWLGDGPEAEGAPVESASDFDMREALERFANGLFGEGIDRDDVYSVCESFLQSTPELIGKMKESLVLKDAEQLWTTAHALKGTFAIFGFNSLRGWAAEIEYAAREGHWSGLDETMDLIARAYGEARQRISEFICVPAK
jgi:polar amino acid transport system substrate-binding protein